MGYDFCGDWKRITGIAPAPVILNGGKSRIHCIEQSGLNFFDIENGAHHETNAHRLAIIPNETTLQALCDKFN